jgi:molecular chaperone GrpE
MSDPASTPEADRPPADDPASADTETEVERLGRELAELEARARSWREDYLRAIAEADNVRKRAQRDIEAAHRFAVDKFAADLLEARDSLELGLASGEQADPARLREGMDATLRMINRAFERAGIVVLDPQGAAFNPELHEAMVAQSSADQPPGTVLAVIQRGYQLNGRLLRPARVVVARAPDEKPN